MFTELVPGRRLRRAPWTRSGRGKGLVCGTAARERRATRSATSAPPWRPPETPRGPRSPARFSTHASRRTFKLASHIFRAPPLRLTAVFPLNHSRSVFVFPPPGFCRPNNLPVTHTSPPNHCSGGILLKKQIMWFSSDYRPFPFTRLPQKIIIKAYWKGEGT